MSEAASFLTFRLRVRSLAPQVALILGSGIELGTSCYEQAISVSFADVPGLVSTSIAGHAGRISAGKCGGTTVLVFHGRLHYYEGHTWDRVAMPVRLAADLGARMLLLTNAAGGIHDALEPGSLMAIRDHLFWQRPWSWRGLGPAGCDCPNGERPSCYSARLVELLQAVEKEQGRVLMAGVYGAVTGPCYETPAEIRALRAAGADAVGMSTAHEVATAHALGVECAAVSCITNRAAGLSAGPLSHQEVIDTARQAADRLTALIERFVARLSAAR
jgi:purine-nucleoside phosphorylase